MNSGLQAAESRIYACGVFEPPPKNLPLKEELDPLQVPEAIVTELAGKWKLLEIGSEAWYTFHNFFSFPVLPAPN